MSPCGSVVIHGERVVALRNVHAFITENAEFPIQVVRNAATLMARAYFTVQ